MFMGVNRTQRMASALTFPKRYNKGWRSISHAENGFGFDFSRAIQQRMAMNFSITFYE
jgi:hypothetical protein